MAGHAHARIGGERGEHVVEAAQVHNDKRTALLIAVLALFLALVETGGKGAQTTALSANIEASDLWAFFQARTVRQTVVRTAAEMAPLLADPARAAEVEAQAGRWRADERRWESEPEKGDGRRELAERAKAAERARDRAMAAHHLFEVGSGALQVAIVVASASIITATPLLAAGGALVGAVGVGFGALAYFAPEALHGASAHAAPAHAAARH